MCMKSLKIPNGKSESLNPKKHRQHNGLDEKGQKDKQRSTIHYTKKK